MRRILMLSDLFSTINDEQVVDINFMNNKTGFAGPIRLFKEHTRLGLKDGVDFSVWTVTVGGNGVLYITIEKELSFSDINVESNCDSFEFYINYMCEADLSE